jgi:two-component system, chemotaxis family, chemotaxis protein CheY
MMISTADTKTVSPGSALAELGSGPEPAAVGEPGLIMLIEDDFVLRGSLATLLDTEGYRVESAANALDALRRLERPPKPSLILLDIMLPYMDGLEFRAMQRRTTEIADIPVVVITAVGIRREVADEHDLRYAFFKPLDRPRLIETIRHLCPPAVS